MHILSGIYKGKPLKSPLNIATHPMGSREKLALFNMLTGYLKNATVLDAYAGSGALGLEALSRDAQTVIFVEKDPRVAKILRDNAANILSPDKNYEIIIKNVKSYQPTNQFDIIFLDPPYNNFHPADFQHLAHFLKPKGLLALSSPKNTPLSSFPELQLLSTHTYAAARISLFTR